MDDKNSKHHPEVFACISFIVEKNVIKRAANIFYAKASMDQYTDRVRAFRPIAKSLGNFVENMDSELTNPFDMVPEGEDHVPLSWPHLDKAAA